MTKLATTFFLLLFIARSFCSLAQSVSANDFRVLCRHWHGSLTYLDYSSGKPYTMPADLVVTRIGKTNRLIFSNIYPNEYSANAADTVTLSPDGKYIGTGRVIAKRKNEKGGWEIITEEQGKDGNEHKPATFRHTYTFSPSFFSKRKEVQFTGDSIWIKRHEYSYQSQPGRLP